MAPGIEVSLDFFLACEALKSGFLTFENSFVAVCDRSVEKFKLDKVENGQLIKVILYDGAASKAMSTCFLDMEKKVADLETEKGLWTKSNCELLASAR